jgi:hypothetical protein
MIMVDVYPGTASTLVRASSQLGAEVNIISDGSIIEARKRIVVILLICLSQIY